MENPSEQFASEEKARKNLDSRIIYAVLLLTLAVGFFLGDYFSGPISIIIRLILLAVVAVILYLFMIPVSAEEDILEDDPEFEETTNREGVSEQDRLIETENELPEMRSSALNENPENNVPEDEKFDFYREIDRFFRHLMKMVKSTFVANSAVIFLYDQMLRQLRIEYAATESEDSLFEGDAVDIEGTLPGNVFRSREPLLEQNIPDELQVAGYYRTPAAIKSFLGVPIQVNTNTVGVLVIDSTNEEEFGESDQELLESFQGLISQGFSIMAERERYALVNRSLEAQQALMEQLNEEDSLENILNGFTRACQMVFQYDRISISMVNSDTKETAKIVRVVGQTDEFGEGTEFNVFDGLTGWVIRKNRPLLLADLEKGELFRPRFTKEEKSNYELRSFLGVPISYQQSIYGAVSVESKHPDFYSEWDQKILGLMANQIGLALSNMLNKPVDMNKGTRVPVEQLT